MARYGGRPPFTLVSGCAALGYNKAGRRLINSAVKRSFLIDPKAVPKLVQTKTSRRRSKQTQEKRHSLFLGHSPAKPQRTTLNRPECAPLNRRGGCFLSLKQRPRRSLFILFLFLNCHFQYGNGEKFFTLLPYRNTTV